MADDIVRVELEGYPQFERDLRKLSKDYVRILRKEIRDAAKPIVTEIRARYRAQHPRGRGRGRARTRASDIAQFRRARGGSMLISANKSKSIPWLRPQEFGAEPGSTDILGRELVTRFPRRQQSPVGSGPASNFFFVSGYEGREEASKKIVAAIDRANRGVFPDLP